MVFAPTSEWTSWGRVNRAPHHVARPTWRQDIPAVVAEGRQRFPSLLPVGLRRSYGDSVLNPAGAVIDMTGVDRMIAFDPATGVLRADAGLSFDALLRALVPRGFFLPVTPGTRFVTLGGAVANDVHGKNHHGAGTIGCWVRRLGLLRSDGREHDLGPDDETGLFAATIGGLGLTGIITWVELSLMPITSTMMDVETIAFDDLDGFFALAEASEQAFDYTVAWVDCLAGGARTGRGLFTRGRHAAAGPLEAGKAGGPTIPMDFPGFALNGLSIRAFNALYAWNGRRTAGNSIQHYQPFFYPLDAIGQWNRMYGQRGMFQYQSVVPPDAARDATAAMLRAIASAGEGSFLAVLKTFGDRPSPGMLSFPSPGTTLALDFPNRGDGTLALLARLDAIVREAGGKLYPAKDGRIPRDMFRAGYPGWERFASHVDPLMSSMFWNRVGP
ncbi:FAD-binding oxidoreductase [Phreatobacter cathodiphilus]|uniref:FAD-binding oxidoreductase n=1 Tax=Phreatobacter cathodiphilus TaxID=1868589 RepID=A0A2S0NBI8_9HYPH|nr:FAD-binding oxidoreductase [Phreatobacter cathodiphilus]AVO45515.1 FAD-binding oxidoreductase [Phreatobacter cathodiphilus]